MRRQRYLWLGVLIAAAAILIPTWVMNDFFAAAQGARVQYGETITGELDTANPVDNWIFDGIRGDIITIRLSRVDGNLLPIVSLSDPDNKLLLSLDWPQVGLPDIVLTVSIQTTGPHTLNVQTMNGTTGSYAIDLTLQEAAELEESVLAYGRVVSGEITDSTFQEIWTFRGIGGDVVDITMAATSGDLDTFLSLISPQGEVLNSSDQGSTGTDAALFATTLPSSGNYSVVARRSGVRVGEGGTTTGNYDLALTLRNSATEAEITPIKLVRGIETRGRLNASAPAALFSIEAEGVLTLALDTINPAQIGTVSVLTTNRVLLHTFSGIGVARGSVTLPSPDMYFIEVAAAGVRDTAPVDFSLIVDQLTTAQRASLPLQYNRPQIVALGPDQPEAWYFYGRTGDLIMIDVIPFSPTLQGSPLQILNPAGDVLATRIIHDKTTQALQLTATGQHEILLDSIALQAGYQITVYQQGTNGLAYEQYAEPLSQGQLLNGSNQAVTSTLPSGATHAWDIDAANAGNWRFQLSQTGSDIPVAIAIEGITGDWLGVATTKRLTNETAMLVSLPQPGRYRVLVFDPTGSAPHTYTLWGGPTSTGQLALNTQVKSVLSAEIETVDRWQITIPAESLLNVDIEVADDGILPNVYVIRPDGQIATSNLPLELGSASPLLGIPIEQGGEYELVIIQPTDNQRLVYQLEASIVQPFTFIPATPSPITYPVSEVYATAAQDDDPTQRVIIAEQIAPSIHLEANFVSNAQSITLEDLIPGEIPSGQRYQAWRFSANVNQMIGFSVVTLEGQIDPGIIILNNDGAILAENYQTQSSTNYITYRFDTTSTYTAIVALKDGGRYTLLLNSLPRMDESIQAVLNAQVLGYGETARGELIHENNQQIYLFFGRVGDSISARTLLTQGDIALNLELSQIDGQILSEVDATGSAALAAITDYVLPADGIYQLAVSHGPNQANIRGRFAIHLSVTETSATPRQGGQLEGPAIVNLGGDDEQRWLFSAQSGEAVDIKVESLSVNGPSPLTLQITDTAGTPFLRKDADLGQGALVFENVLLPRTGVYQAVVSGGGRSTGVYRISLNRDDSHIQDSEWAIQYGETTGKVLTQVNALDVWTFAGSKNDIVSITVRPVRGDPLSLNVQLRAANGSSLAAGSGGENSITRLEQIVLPSDGHYSIIVGNINSAFDGATAYEITLRLENTSARSIGSTVTYGQTVEGHFYLDDRTDTWVFNGEQGDVVAATLESRSPNLQPTIRLLSTDWRTAAAEEFITLAGIQALADQPTTLQFELPVAGTYTLKLDDVLLSGGTYALTLDNLRSTTEIAGSMRYDQARSGQISANHLVDRWSFNGAFGDQISIDMQPDSRTSLAPVVTLISPAGQPLISQTAPPSEMAQINTYALPETGRYIIEIARNLAEHGNTEGRYNVELRLENTTEFNYPTTTYNQIQRDVLNDSNPVDSWAMNAEAGEVVRVLAEATSGDLDVMLRVYGENGRELVFNDDAQNMNAEIVVEIPETGRYFVDVLRYGVEQGQTDGNYSLLIERVYRPAAQDLSEHVITYGDRVSGSVDAEQSSDIWAFSGETGDTLRAKIQFPRDDSPLALYLVDPAGDILATGERIIGDSIIDSFVLPYSGSYALEVRRPGDARAEFSPYALDLTLLATDEHTSLQQGGYLVAGQSLTGFFTQVPAAHSWQFMGNVGHAVSLTLNRISGSLPQQIVIIAPNGIPILSVNIPSGSVNAYSTGTLELSLDGIYTISIMGDEHAIGSTYRLSLREAAGIIDGNRLLTPMQDGFGLITNDQPAERWTFSAETGEAINLRVATTAGNLIPTLMLWGPDNRPLVEGLHVHYSGYNHASINRIVAPMTGNYQIVVGRDGSTLGTTTGEYRLMVRKDDISPQAAAARDVAFGTQILDYVTGNAPAYYAVQGLAGDVVAISAQLTNGAVVPELTIETEAGERLAVSVQVTDTEAFIPALVFPEDGRYIIALTSQDTIGYAFSAASRAQDLADEISTRNLGRGRNFSDGVLNPAQPTVWLLPAEAGEVLTFTVDTSGGGLRADVTLYGPNGYVANGVETPGPGVELGPIRLPENGDYRLVVGSWLGATGGSTGQYSVRVDAVEDGISGSEGGHIAARNQRVTGGFIAEDTQDKWTFDGKAGEVVTIQAVQITGEGSLSLQLQPTETRSEPSTSYRGTEIVEIMLPETGRYTLQVDGRLSGDTSVEYRLTVLRVQRSLLASMAVAQGITWGEDFAGILQEGESSDAWVFFGESGERISFEVTTDDGTFLPEVYLLGPENTILAADTSLIPGSAVGQANVLLPSSGFYGLIISGAHEGSAHYAVRISQVTPSMSMGSELNGQIGEIGTGHLTVSAPVEHWTLDPGYSGTYILDVTSYTDSVVLDVFVQNAAGDVISQVMEKSAATQAIVRLNAEQSYVALVSGGPITIDNRYQIRLIPASSLVRTQTLMPGTADVGRIDSNLLNNEWRLSGQANQVWNISLTRTDGDVIPQIVIVGPEGTVQQNNMADENGNLAITFQVPAEGQYAIEVTRAQVETTSGDYTLIVETE